MTPEQESDLKLFGRVLRRTRETHAGRLVALPDGVAPLELSSRRLIGCLTRHGSPISSGAYSSWESGNSLPQNPETTLDALFACFGLEKTDPIAILLIDSLAIGVYTRDLGNFLPTFDTNAVFPNVGKLRRDVEAYVNPQPQNT